ncbi:MAG: hypothetical protein AB1726_10490 [Planctomycetota bacterium]
MTDAPLRSTPHLDRLLAGLRGRLIAGVWLHGTGTALLAAAIWLAFAFVADWGLRVPHALRLTHGVVLVALGAAIVVRDLWRPRRRVPGRAGLAVLLERGHRELAELLVSAVEFQAATPRDLPPHGAAPALVARVIEDAEARARNLDAGAVLDGRGPARRFGLGFAGAIALALLGLSHPLHAGIFLDHLLGGTRPWPQRTVLTVDIDDLEAGTTVERTAGLIRARVARGTDVPVVVRAAGEVPDELLVHFAGSRELLWTTGGRPVVRRLLPSLQEDVHFWITGGDDTDGDPRIEVTVLQPPDVAGRAVRVTPPAYSGLPGELVFDADVEVLAGSTLRIYVRPSPPSATGVARLLAPESVLPLTPETIALAPAGEAESADPARWLAFDLAPASSVAYRIELVDESGLANPDPGVYRVQVIEDRAPEVAVLSPARAEFEAVPGGAIPLRVRAEDDFGLVSLFWRVRPAGSTGAELPPTGEGELAVVPLASAGEGPAARVLSAFGGRRLEVAELAGAADPVAVDQRYVFEIAARDNRQPVAGEGQASPLRLRVVSAEELLRRLQDRLGKARLDAVRLAELEREKLHRVEDLLAAAGSDEGLGAADTAAVQAAVAGERRVLGDARALGRELAAVAEDVLYARIDGKAGGLLEFYDERAAAIADLSFHPTPWRELAAAHRAGRLGASGFAAKLVEIVDLELEIAEDHALPAAAALDRVEATLETGRATGDLQAAIGHMTRALERLDVLLERLAEWDNFQNVLTLTRDILNRQRALRERTRQFASDPGPPR